MRSNPVHHDPDLFSERGRLSQIKREVENAVNKGVYIIPFGLMTSLHKSLEYFISTSQWMDAFSPPLERHLDNLAKTVKAVLKSPPLPVANVPARPEKPSIRTASQSSVFAFNPFSSLSQLRA